MNKLSVILLNLNLFLSCQVICCECENYKIGHREIYNAEIIVGATILSVRTRDSNTYSVKIEVDEVFKGKEVKNITVYGFSTSCDPKIVADQRWIFFINRGEGGNFVPICSPSFNIKTIDDSAFRATTDFLRSYQSILDSTIYTPEELSVEPNYYLLEQKLDQISKSLNCSTAKITCYFEATLTSEGVLINIKVMTTGSSIEISEDQMSLLRTKLQEINELESGYIGNSKVSSRIVFPLKICPAGQ